MALTEEQKQRRAAYMREWQEKNREKVNEYNRRYYATHAKFRLSAIKRGQATYQRRKDDSYFRERRAIAQAKERRRRADRSAARHAVGHALRAGKLIKPAQCEHCGWVTPRLEAHHPDYTQPLAVQWLCKVCHRIADGKYRPGFTYVWRLTFDRQNEHSEGSVWMIFKLQR